MSKIVVLDPGHGGSDPGACANGLKEKLITLPVCNLIKEELERHGIVVKFTRTTDVYKGLSERAAYANSVGASLFVSNHCNSASATSARGTECYSYPTAGIATTRLSANVSARLASTLGIPNRGAKQANFAVLRLTNMPAILVENAFISNSSDAALLRDKQSVIATCIAEEILRYFGITCNGHASNPPAVSATSGMTFYRVVVGSYKEKSNANDMVAKLKKDKIDSFLDAFKKDGVTFFRVIAGSFEKKANAEERLKEIEKKGYKAFLAAYTKNATTTSSTPATPAPAPAKKYVNLPPKAKTWNVYPVKAQPVVGNECGKLAPANYGGLSYEILANPMSGVYTIQTSSFGRVNIYADTSVTSATITSSPKY